jgi:hypothetical protein
VRIRNRGGRPDEVLKGQPNPYEDRLEGKIAAALLLLDPALSASDGEKDRG